MKYKHITKVNRLEISILLNKGYSIRDISKSLGKNPSSISREIKNNSVKGKYNPNKANKKSRVNRLYSKYQGMKIVGNTELRNIIHEKLESYWTPEEISGWLKVNNNNIPVISAKSIYKYLYSHYGQKYCKYLPSKQYRPEIRKSKKIKKQIIPKRVSIDNRPKIIDRMSRLGDFEADTLGRPKYELKTLVGLVDRKSLFFLACKVRRPKYSIDGFKQLLNPYHRIVKSITFDNGVENARHLELNTRNYFCDPYSSWQKPIIENTFGRLRRWIPKKTSLNNYTDKEISDIINIMNNTPRKRLNYKTPREVFEEQLINAGVAVGGIM